MSTTDLHFRTADGLGNVRYRTTLKRVMWFLLVLGIIVGASLVPTLPWVMLCTAVGTAIFLLRFMTNKTLPFSMVAFLGVNVLAVMTWLAAEASIWRGLFVVPSVFFVFLMRDMREETASLAMILTFLLGFLITPSTLIGSNSAIGEDAGNASGMMSLMLLSFLYVINGSGRSARLRTLLFASLSFFWDDRRYFYILALLTGLLPRLPIRRPFLIGALFSIIFPIASLVISMQVDFSSLWARYRQLLFIGEAIFQQPKLLLFGNAIVNIELPNFFWAGDTKIIGSIFEYGISFVAVNALLLFWISRYYRLSDFQKFMLGIIAFGYLGADPAFYGSVMLLSLVRR